MAKDAIVKGATSVLDEIFIQDSSSTTGAGLTGLTSASGSLVCCRGRDDDGNAGGTAITLTSTGTLGTWASGWFKEKDATNMPGIYEIGYTNASLATGSKRVTIYFKGATNMAPCVLQIKLTGTDDQDAVHGGMSALPNTAVTTNASLLTSGTGTDQLSVATGRVDLGKILGTAVSSPATAGILDINVKNINNVAAATPGASGGILISGSNSGTTTLAALTITGATTFTGAITGSNASNNLRINGAAPGAANGLTICGSNAATTFATLTSTGAFTINGASMVAQTGDVFAQLPSHFSTTLITVGGNVGIDWANVANQGTAVDLSATIINSVSGSVNSVTDGVTVTGFTLDSYAGGIALTSAAINSVGFDLGAGNIFFAGPGSLIVIYDQNTHTYHTKTISSVTGPGTQTPTITVDPPYSSVPLTNGTWLFVGTLAANNYPSVH